MENRNVIIKVNNMNKKLIFRAAQLIIGIVIVVVLQKCGDDSVNAPQDFMAGTIAFRDSLFMPSSQGHYAISFYTDLSQPPAVSDSIGTASKNVYWRVTNVTSGSYYIAATFIRSTGAVVILGEYGCATPPSCSAPTKIDFPNYAGTGQLDFPAVTH